MATSSIGKIVKLDDKSARIMAEVLAHPVKPGKVSDRIRTGEMAKLLKQHPIK